VIPINTLTLKYAMTNIKRNMTKSPTDFIDLIIMSFYLSRVLFVVVLFFIWGGGVKVCLFEQKSLKIILFNI